MKFSERLSKEACCSSAPGRMPRVHRHDDVEMLFAQYPRAGIRFLRPLLIVGCATSIGLSILDLLTLCHSPGDCGVSGFWVGVQAVMQLVQLPLRTLLLRRLSEAIATADDERVAIQLLALNRSREWRMNKQLGTIHLCWFFGGVLVDRIARGGVCGLHWLMWLHFW